MRENRSPERRRLTPRLAALLLTLAAALAALLPGGWVVTEVELCPAHEGLGGFHGGPIWR